MTRPVFLLFTFFLFLSSSFITNNYAQNIPNGLSVEEYTKPVEKVLKQVLAPRYKNTFLSNISPSRDYFLDYIKKEEFTPIDQYAEPFYNFAGLEIDLEANRKMSLTNEYEENTGIGLALTDVNNGKTKVIHAPTDMHLSNAK